MTTPNCDVAFCHTTGNVDRVADLLLKVQQILDLCLMVLDLEVHVNMNSLGGMVVQWLTFSPHSHKVTGLDQQVSCGFSV